MPLTKPATFAIEQFGLPVKNVVADLSSKEFFIPGSLIKTVVDTQHPLGYGMQDTVAASFSRSRAFKIVQQERKGEGGEEKTAQTPAPLAESIAHYADKNLLMSGWAQGEEKHIGGKSALLRVKHGDGHVVLFGFRPQFRGQPRGTYKLIFNALYGSAMDDLPEVEVVLDEDTAVE